MSERKYTVREIDGLRRAVDDQWLWGSYSPTHNFTGSARTGCVSRSYREEDRVRIVEERVRTFMLAGLTAEDLIASERPAPPRSNQGEASADE